MIEFPEYEAPEWLADTESPAGTLEQVALHGRQEVSAILWTAAEAPSGPLPLLLVHDGPEYA
ncbi:MAG TPA: hypothetical protein VFB35_05795, partial [Gaiellaceae bacterium]|nr:hypothetical protein [Gaiellaceae bacterium]